MWTKDQVEEEVATKVPLNCELMDLQVEPRAQGDRRVWQCQFVLRYIFADPEMGFVPVGCLFLPSSCSLPEGQALVRGLFGVVAQTVSRGYRTHVDRMLSR